MPTVLIVCGVLVLIGIVGVVMSRDNWRWQNITLVTLLLLFSLLFFFLASKDLRIQQGWRTEIGKWEKAVNEAEKTLKETRQGQYDEAEHKWTIPSLAERQRNVQAIMQGRGRIWTGSGAVGPDGSIAVKIEPATHGIAEKTILFAFEGMAAAQGAEFLGEYEASKVAGADVTLTPVLPLRPTEVQRIVATGKRPPRRPIVLYEIMPTDDDKLYAEKSAAERIALFSPELSPEVKQEFVKDGGQPDANERDASRVWRRVKALRSFDVTFGMDTVSVQEGAELVLDPKSAEERITAGDVAAVEGNDKVYRRPLRDYARLYRDLHLRIDELQRKIKETNDQLVIVQTAQKKVDVDLTARRKERDALTKDKARFVAESQRAKAHADAVEAALNEVMALLRKLYADNVRLDAELVKLTYELAAKLSAKGAVADGGK
jgi:hypothetical protein